MATFQVVRDTVLLYLGGGRNLRDRKTEKAKTIHMTAYCTKEVLGHLSKLTLKLSV